jgi:hypothetical protein
MTTLKEKKVLKTIVGRSKKGTGGKGTVLGVRCRFVDGRKDNVRAETGGRERINSPAVPP